MNKMKVAIAVFKEHVSLRFDCAEEVLFVEFENGEIVSQKMASMEGLNPLQKLRTISTSGATRLVCGAMPGFYRRITDFLGIRIMHAEGMAIDILIEHLKRGESNLIVPRSQRGRGKHRRDGCPWMVTGG